MISSRPLPSFLWLYLGLVWWTFCCVAINEEFVLNAEYDKSDSPVGWNMEQAPQISQPMTAGGSGFAYNVTMFPSSAIQGNWLALAASSTGQIMFAAVPVYGYYYLTVYVSKDYGTTWQATPIRNNWYNSAAFLTVDSTGCKIIGGDYNYAGFASTDCGETWYYQDFDFTGVVLDSSGQYGFASNSYYFYVSTNYGYTWTEVYYSGGYGTNSITMTSNATYLASAVCAGYYVYVYTAANFTAPWKFTMIPLYNTYCYSAVIASGSVGTTLYLVSGQYIYKSTNFGQTWPRLSTSPPFGLYWVAISCDGLCKRIVITGRDYNPQTGRTGSAIQYVSNYYGEAWQRLYYNNTNTSIHVSSYATVISESGDFVASTPLSGDYYPYAEYDGPIFLNCNEYLNISAVMVSSSMTVNYTFTSIGYVCSTFYLNPALSVVSTDDQELGKLHVTIALGNNGNACDGMVIFSGLCGYANASSSRRCTENIELNNTMISPANGGSLSLTSIITVGTGNGDAIGSEGDNAGFTVQLDYMLTALSVSFGVDDSSSSGQSIFDPRTLLPVFFMTVVLTFCGYLVGSLRRRLYDESAFISTGRFALFGFLVSMEIWFFCVMHVNSSTETAYFVYLADLFLALRLISQVPGLAIVVRALAPTFISGTRFYRDLLASNGDDKPSNVVLCILSLGVLFDPQLVVYFPWKERSAAEDLRESLLANNKDRLASSEHVNADRRRRDSPNETVEANHGFPDVIMMDVCTMFCGLAATTSIVSQVICYAAYFGGPGSANEWTGNDLLLRVLLFVYGVGFVLSNVPIFGILYGHLIETLNNVGTQRRFGLVPFVKWCWSYCTSYDWTIRSDRMKRKWAAGTAIPFRVVYSFLIAIITMVLYFMVGQKCQQSYCWTTTFFGVLMSVSGLFFIEVYVTVEYDEDYDPHIDVLDIASMFALDAEKITRLLKFTVVAQSLLEVIAAFWLMTYIEGVFSAFSEGYNRYNFNGGEMRVVRLILVMIFMFPLLMWPIHRYRMTNGSILETAIAFIRVDIFLMYFFLKAMVCWICPLSLLANISVLKSQYGWFAAKSGGTNNSDGSESEQPEGTSFQDNKLLSFQLRDNWDDVDSRKFYDNDDDDSKEDNWLVPVTRSIFVTFDRLSKRFTVVYSFLKLCGTIAFTLFVNTNYLACGDPSKTHSTVTCDVSYTWAPFEYEYQILSHSSSCMESCIGTNYKPTVSYPPDNSLYVPPLPPTPWTCTASLPNACVCNDWMTFQFSIIILHVLHYIVQCYFYMRYNYFDPQQNQINCVETYTFAGKNLTLFLTQPSMCLLSVLEAASIVIVWVELIVKPGVYCSGTFHYDSFDLYFAIFITVVEVYKANMSTCGKLLNRREFWWALWSLVRIDLFIFYGFTLFLQTFFFPFSFVGYLWSGYKVQGSKTIRGSSVVEESLQSAFVPTTSEYSISISHAVVVSTTRSSIDMERVSDR
jgi:hypothetical protein